MLVCCHRFGPSLDRVTLYHGIQKPIVLSSLNIGWDVRVAKKIFCVGSPRMMFMDVHGT